MQSEDLSEGRRRNETYLDALEAQRIPDPTTAGDLARRFEEPDVAALMEAINDIRVKMWRKKLPWQERVTADNALDSGQVEKDGIEIAFVGIGEKCPPRLQRPSR